MADTDTDPIARLARRVWIRSFRIGLREAIASGSVELKPPKKESWAWLARLLMGATAGTVAAQEERIPGLLGIVKGGNDPRTVRRLPEEEMSQVLLESGRQVIRHPSGPSAAGSAPQAKKLYLEIPMDLVARAEALVPGSGAWENAPLWALLTPCLPPLERVREIIKSLKDKLRLHNPSMDERQPHLSDVAYQKLLTMPLEMRVEQYQRGLDPLTIAASADAMSLLAALSVESFITNDDLLLDLHRDAFRKSVQILFADPLMDDIWESFEPLVCRKILAMMWEMPVSTHISSVSAPLIPDEEWAMMIGADRLLVAP
jgi:hypothetical protein